MKENAAKASAATTARVMKENAAKASAAEANGHTL
jgi:hypothetical protein